MTIKDRLYEPVGTIGSVAEKADKALDIFLIKMDEPMYNPHQLIKDTANVLLDIEKEWSEYNNHDIRIGKKTKKILIKSLCGFTLDSFFLTKFNFVVHHTADRHRRVKYTKDKLKDVSYMVTTLLFYKYHDVHEFEVRYSIISVLLEYFTIYEGTSWLVTGKEIGDIIQTVLNTDSQKCQCYYNDYIHKYFLNLEKEKEKKQNKKTKPQCADDLLILRQEDMTKEEWYSEIMRCWKCSRSSVFRFLHKFGLDVRQYGDTQYRHPRIKELEDENALLKNQIVEMKEKYDRDIEIKDEIINQLTKKIEIFINR